MKEAAQDNSRENQQKDIFGFGANKHSRDAKYDAYYKMPIDFKTRNILKSGDVSTKRKFKMQTFQDWENTLLVISDYEDPSKINDSHWLVFPEALLEWRNHQKEKLLYNQRASYYPLSGVEKLKKLLLDNNLWNKSDDHDTLFEQFTAQAHLNDPRIPNKLFKTHGKEININRKTVRTAHPEWFMKVPCNVDKKTFLKNKIESYKSWKGD